MERGAGGVGGCRYLLNQATSQPGKGAAAAAAGGRVNGTGSSEAKESVGGRRAGRGSQRRGGGAAPAARQPAPGEEPARAFHHGTRVKEWCGAGKEGGPRPEPSCWSWCFHRSTVNGFATGSCRWSRGGVRQVLSIPSWMGTCYSSGWTDDFICTLL